ncbi:HAMP domain-containing sensor histidine kinase [Cryptosporangium minutisporangium]|uniref:histidine kinase n=1 Tax=Cryptosporangium minutisporangium TaxID=113569 RepID=A0ABP6SQF8_9ACTN
MTVYGGTAPVRPSRLRPTLRLRLTLLNGILLVGAGLLLLVLSYLLVRDQLMSTEQLAPGSSVTLVDADGSTHTESATAWQESVASTTTTDLLVKGFLALVAIGVAGVAGGHLLTGRALRPLHQVTATARRLSTETLDHRLHHTGPDDEVKELADTFDSMLDRLSAAFGSQKRFVANASHELRTPLAVMRTEIDVTLADSDATVEDLRRMGTVVRDASSRANELIEALLLLARTEAQAGRLAKQIPVDLARGVPSTLAAVAAETERLSLQVSTDFAPAVVVGDPSLLERLAGNLVENAVRYNLTHGVLNVRTGSDGRQAWLVVANDGPDLDQRDVPGLFEPFRRGGVERTGTRGAGLGLSIVRAVAGAHGGTVQAVARPGGGLEVTVLIPAADPAIAATLTAPGRDAAPTGRVRGVARPQPR